MANEHAILSASSSHRWLECIPSARLELEFQDYESKAAREEIAAHLLSEHNSQMMLYALGLLKKFGKEYDIKKVRMVKIQPRRENVSVWETTVTQLKK